MAAVAAAGALDEDGAQIKQKTENVSCFFLFVFNIKNKKKKNTS